MDNQKSVAKLEEITNVQLHDLLDYIEQKVEKGDLGYRVANPDVKQRMLEILDKNRDKLYEMEAKYKRLKQKYKYDKPELLSKLTSSWSDYVNHYERLLRKWNERHEAKASLLEIEKSFDKMLLEK